MSTYRIGRCSDRDLDKLARTVWAERNPNLAHMVPSAADLEAIAAEAWVVPEPGDKPAEPEWAMTPLPQVVTDVKYVATVEGLQIEIKVESGGRYVTWNVRGYLGDIRVWGWQEGTGYNRPLTDAKAEAIRAARRMYAAGIRGEKRAPESGETQQ